MVHLLSHLGEASLFGAVQGLAEFLPISSSGHLLLLHSIINIGAVNELTFDVALHVGTLLALVWYFWADIRRYIVAAWSWVRRRPAGPTADQRIVWFLILASVPGAILGAAFDSWFETAVREPWVVAITLMAAGVMLWWADRTRRTEPMETLTGWKAFMIGCGQALALIPGVSRSGASISFGRFFGLNREAAARFSFLMAIPITAGAALKKAFDLLHVAMTGQQLLDMAVGAVVATVVGYVAIRGLLKFVARRSYAIFVVYRLVLGAVVLAVVFWR